MDDAQRPPPPGDGSGSSPGTGNPYFFAFRGGPAHRFKGIVASQDSDPFGDTHAVSRTTDINVNDVARVDVSVYRDEATDGRS